jgi:hypothetical protein
MAFLSIVINAVVTPMRADARTASMPACPPPITTTPYFLDSIKSGQIVKYSSVSRETIRRKSQAPIRRGGQIPTAGKMDAFALG